MAVISRRHSLIGVTALFAEPMLGVFPTAATLEDAGFTVPLIMGFGGTEPGDERIETLRKDIASGNVAGVLLLDRNVRSKAQVARLCAHLKSAARDPTLMVAIDQEGGAVARASPSAGFQHWMSAADLARHITDESAVYEYYLPRARELADVGINLNFGPVVDLAVNPSNPIIVEPGRAYSGDPETVIRYARAFVSAHRDAGVRTCLKHFPGHGSSDRDSHRGGVDISASWASQELETFRILVREGFADSIMSAHVYHPDFSDSDERPASLSKKSAMILREQLGFKGPIITDDLQMGAISARYSEEVAAIDALAAGNDILLFSMYEQPSPALPLRLRDILATALNNRTINREEFVISRKRIDRFRTQLR